jgi:hypothetical protein
MAEPRDGAAGSETQPSAESATRGQTNSLARAGQRGTRRRMPRALSSLFANKLATFGAFVLILVALGAILAPVIAPHDPNQQVLVDNRQPGIWSSEGSTTYILGTDSLGRDIFSRILYGAQISLLVGLTAVALAGAIGITLGLVSGYYGRFVDDVIMRIADIQLAIPFILLAIAILAVLGPGLQNVILTLGVANWVVYGRVVRCQVLSWKELRERLVKRYALNLLGRYFLPDPEDARPRKTAKREGNEWASRVRFVTPANWGFDNDRPSAGWSAGRSPEYPHPHEDEAAKSLSRPAPQRRLHADGVRRACPGAVLQQGKGGGDPHHAARASSRGRRMRSFHV